MISRMRIPLNRRIAINVISIIVAFLLFLFVVCFRNLNFVINSGFYAEDASFLDRIIKEGYFKAAFENRYGSADGFQNLGNMTLLWLAWSTSKIFFGKNVLYLPTLVGLFGNMLIASVATLAYYFMKRRYGLISGFITGLCVVLIPLNGDIDEVLGRVLNTPFIYPVIATLIVSSDAISNYSKETTLNICDLVKRFILGIILIGCCLSFPVCYGIVGIALLLGIVMTGQGGARQYVINNILQILVLFYGVIKMPSMIGSNGGAGGLETNTKAIIEFVFARHILYGFIAPFYTRMNNLLIICIFVIWLTIVALPIMYCRKERYFSGYLVFLLSVIVTVGSSAYMRVGLSSYLDNYQYTYPDRYFYGCNIVCILLFIFSINMISNKMGINGKVKRCVFVGLLALLICSPNLYVKDYSSPQFVLTQCSFLDRIEAGYYNAVEEDDYVQVGVDPNSESWYVNFPREYVVETLKAKGRLD